MQDIYTCSFHGYKYKNLYGYSFNAQEINWHYLSQISHYVRNYNKTRITYDNNLQLIFPVQLVDLILGYIDVFIAGDTDIEKTWITDKFRMLGNINCISIPIFVYRNVNNRNRCLAVIRFLENVAYCFRNIRIVVSSIGQTVNCETTVDHFTILLKPLDCCIGSITATNNTIFLMNLVREICLLYGYQQFNYECKHSEFISLASHRIVLKIKMK